MNTDFKINVFYLHNYKGHGISQMLNLFLEVEQVS